MNKLKSIFFGIAALTCITVIADSKTAYSSRVGSMKLSLNALAFEHCTCTFIMEKDHHFCEDYIFADVPLSPKLFKIKIKEDRKEITVSSKVKLNLLGARVIFEDEMGCQFK